MNTFIEILTEITSRKERKGTIYKIWFVAVVLYRHETWSLTSREGHC
jgi:hypothetical protein